MLKTIKTPVKRSKIVFSHAAGEHFDQNKGLFFEIFKNPPPCLSQICHKGGFFKISKI